MQQCYFNSHLLSLPCKFCPGILHTFLKDKILCVDKKNWSHHYLVIFSGTDVILLQQKRQNLSTKFGIISVLCNSTLIYFRKLWPSERSWINLRYNQHNIMQCKHVWDRVTSNTLPYEHLYRIQHRTKQARLFSSELLKRLKYW